MSFAIEKHFKSIPAYSVLKIHLQNISELKSTKVVPTNTQIIRMKLITNISADGWQSLAEQTRKCYFRIF